jgi:DNA modification methylase|tara:strand:+ start:613 stop:1452 length:840 start_codon:yes stop_codon:yes gene_type:complete
MGKIINVNCIKSPEFIDNNSVDLFFQDPPYFTTSIDWDNQWKNNEEYYAWCKLWISDMYDQLKENGSAYVCCQWLHSGMYQVMLQEAGFNILNRITWKKDKGRGSNSNWKQMHEDIWFVSKSKNYTFNVDDVKIEKKVIAPYRDDEGNPKDWWVNKKGEKVRLTYPGNLWETISIPFWSSHEVKSYAKSKKSPNNKFQKHSTQKPKELVKRCILASSNEGDFIVDYFGGSGTTLIASNETRRICTIFEKDKTYCEIIKTRVKNEKNPTPMNTTNLSNFL